MNRISKVILTLFALQSTTAVAALTEPDLATLSSFKNYATNGGAEHSRAGWTVSGTSSSVNDFAVDTANKYDGNAGFAWTPANADNYLSNTAVTITSSQGLSGQNCSAIVYTKTAVATHALEAFDGTNVLATVTIPISTNYTPVTLTWPCSASGTNRVRFNAGSTTAIYFDSLKWGDARGLNVSQVSQASLVGTLTYPGQANCAWTRTGVGSDGFDNFAADADCATRTVTGSISASAGLVPEANYLNAPPGVYLVVVTYTARKAGASDASIGLRLTDGTTSFSQQFYPGTAQLNTPFTQSATFTRSTGGNITWKIQGLTELTANSVILNNATSGLHGLTFSVYRFPTAEELVYRPGNVALQPAGEIMTFAGSTCPGGWLPADSTAVSRATYPQLYARIGTAFGVGDGSTTFNLPDLRGIFASFAGTQTFGSVTYTRTLGNVGKQNDQIQSHNHQFNAENQSSANNGPGVHRDDAGNDSAVTITVGTPTNARTGTQTHPANLPMTACIRMADVTSGAPLLVNSVTSSSAGAERVERATITCSGASSIISQSGSWISSIGNVSAGSCSITIAAGLFSAAPTCTASPFVVSPGANMTMAYLNAASATSLVLHGRFSTSGSTTISNITSDSFYVTCMGPR